MLGQGRAWGALVNGTRLLIICRDWAVGIAPGRALQGRFEALGGFLGDSLESFSQGRRMAWEHHKGAYLKMVTSRCWRLGFLGLWGGSQN